MKLLKLPDSPKPTTFEEWIEIHGEPVYVEDVQKKQLEIRTVTVQTPEQTEINVNTLWTEDAKPNYETFVRAFAQAYNYVYCNGVFYSPEGAINTKTIRQEILSLVWEVGYKGRADVHVNSILNSYSDFCNVSELILDKYIIPLANGDLHLNDTKNWTFRHGEKKHCAYRLPVNYNPLAGDVMPLFNKWLNDVFEPEDIPVIQEIFGYCLVPTTKAQEMFIVVGDGGTGKSGVGAILKGLLGNALVPMETQTLVSQRFQTANLENKLVAYDDDLGSAALKETGLLKKLVSADTPIQAERKYESIFTFNNYCRIVASTNIMLSSLYDNSDGFYRRLHPIKVKPKNVKRKNISGFYDMILDSEKDQILLWALEGLARVIQNGWKISWSKRSKDYFKENRESNEHFDSFLANTIEYDNSSNVSVKELKEVYHRWCRENGFKEMSDRKLSVWMANNSNITLSRTVYRDNKYVRGYTHMRIVENWKY